MTFERELKDWFKRVDERERSFLYIILLWFYNYAMRREFKYEISVYGES